MQHIIIVSIHETPRRGTIIYRRGRSTMKVITMIIRVRERNGEGRERLRIIPIAQLTISSSHLINTSLQRSEVIKDILN